MKLLLVFVSAVVLVAHGHVIPSAVDDGPQGVFTEEAPAGSVFGAEDEPRTSAPQEPQGEEAATESVSVPETGVYIPIASRACTNAACVNVCRQLGYRYGICISPSSCLCS